MNRTKFILLCAAVFTMVGMLASKADATLVTSDSADQEIYASGSKWVFQSTGRIGKGGPAAANAQLVLPFELPALPVGESVVTAKLAFNLSGILAAVSTDLADLNVYAGRSSGTATVLSTDYFDVTSLPSGVVLAQSSVATFASALGPVTTSAAGDASLGTWLQSLYDGGAVAGDFAFVSLAVSDPASTNNFKYYTLATANGSPAPTLDITTAIASVPEPSAFALFGITSLAMLMFRKKSDR